jgi:hypothetical protein
MGNRHDRLHPIRRPIRHSRRCPPSRNRNTPRPGRGDGVRHSRPRRDRVAPRGRAAAGLGDRLRAAVEPEDGRAARQRAAGFVAFSGLVRRVDARLPVATDGETHYAVEIVCRGAEESRMRSLLLHGRLGLGPDVTAATGRSAARCPIPEREFWTPFLDRSAFLDSRCPEMVEKPNDSNGPISGHPFMDSAGVQKCRSGPAVQAIAPAARSAAISRSP